MIDHQDYQEEAGAKAARSRARVAAALRGQAGYRTVAEQVVGRLVQAVQTAGDRAMDSAGRRHYDKVAAEETTTILDMISALAMAAAYASGDDSRERLARLADEIEAGPLR